MNHLTAWAITITAFSSGLYGIYKYILAKYYFTYDIKPIHYWLDRPTKIKKRYKTFRKHKTNNRNKLTKITKISKLNNRNIGKSSYAKYSLNRWSASK